MRAARDETPGRRPSPTPLLVKLAPDLSPEDLRESLTAAMDAGIDGIIATNTTLTRDGLKSPQANETGGLSGAPLRVSLPSTTTPFVSDTQLTTQRPAASTRNIACSRETVLSRITTSLLASRPTRTGGVSSRTF